MFITSLLESCFHVEPFMLTVCLLKKCCKYCLTANAPTSLRDMMMRGPPQGLFAVYLGPDPTAAYLTAIDAINSNPALYLGNASFRVEG